jgi:dihydrofolate reductase
MTGGTTFHFVAETPHEVLARATAVAGDMDVRIGGGVTTVKQFLEAGLVDRLHVAIAPILLGRGNNLWSDLRGFEAGFDVVSETAESGTVHVTFTRS